MMQLSAAALLLALPAAAADPSALRGLGRNPGAVARGGSIENGAGAFNGDEVHIRGLGSGLNGLKGTDRSEEEEETVANLTNAAGCSTAFPTSQRYDSEAPGAAASHVMTHARAAFLQLDLHHTELGGDTKVLLTGAFPPVELDAAALARGSGWSPDLPGDSVTINLIPDPGGRVQEWWWRGTWWGSATPTNTERS